MMKKLFRNIHLYLSLAAGIFIMLACVTGSIMVFEDEINHLIHSNRYFVEATGNKIPIDELISQIENEKKNYKITGLKIYQETDRSIELGLSPIEKEAKNTPKLKEKELEKRKAGGLTAYVNPYNGKVLELEDRRNSFFKKVEMLHRFLLSKKGGVGHYVMSYSSLFFFFILLTGLVLWWPKSNAILKQRLKIKWDGSTKRLIHDLHIVLGFYTSVFLIVIVMTGLVMSFNWINKGIFTITHSSPKNPEPPKSSVIAEMPAISIHKIQENLASKLASAQEYSIRYPNAIDGVFQINILNKTTSQNTANTYYADQYTGTILGNLAFADKNLGQKIRSYVKPIHTGEVFGLGSKIINFLIVLITLTFPVTGTLMWLNRLKKKKKVKPVL